MIQFRKNGPPAVPGPPIEGKTAKRWHAETFWCSLRGHDAPAYTARGATPETSLIALSVGPEGEQGLMARCVRCDAWVIANPAYADEDEPPALAEVHLPKRGKELRDAIILKVIAVDRGFHAIIFTLAAVGLLLLDLKLGSLQDGARHLVNNAQSTLSSTGQESGRSYTIRELHRFIDLKPTSLIVLAVTAMVYALIEGIEAVGLWKEKRWAEYLTALATAGFLPLEIHELIDRTTVVRVGALAINIAVLVYLVFAKRLFGVRGGMPQDKALLKADEHLNRLPGQPT